MLENFKKQFNEPLESWDEKEFKIKPVNAKELRISQTVTSGPFPGIDGITGLKISYQLNEFTLLYRTILDAEAGYDNKTLWFWIPSFETKPIRNKIGSQIFQSLLETIKEIYEFLTGEGIKIDKLYIAGNLSSNDKKVGNWVNSIPCYQHFAEKYDLDIEIKKCYDLAEKQVEKTYSNFLTFKEECTSGNFYLYFTNSTVQRITENKK